MIYRHLLVSAEPIVGAEKLIGDQTAVLLRNYHPIPDIDATILRTCRAVYEEGVNILYRWNKFHFSDSRAIKIFKETHLLSRSCLPPQIKYYGRLALLRSVSLKIAHPNGADMMNLNVRRAFIWGTWLTEFFSVEGRLNRYSSAYQVGFPALEKLRLDFTDWQLAADEGLRVSFHPPIFASSNPTHESPCSARNVFVRKREHTNSPRSRLSWPNSGNPAVCRNLSSSASSTSAPSKSCATGW